MIERDFLENVIKEMVEINNDFEDLGVTLDPMISAYWKIHNRHQNLLKIIKFYYNEEFNNAG